MNALKSVSIVIPNYNNSKYLRQCVRSVISQSYQNIKEVIIVDDKSTDDSVIIIKEISDWDPRVVPIFLEHNRGVSHARNSGLSFCKGDYVTFLDADDFYFDTEKITNEMNIINESDDKIVVYSVTKFVDKDGILKENNLKKSEGFLEGNIHHRLMIGLYQSIYLMRDYCINTSLLKLNQGYNQSLSLFEDYELLLRLAQTCKFICTYKNGTAYRDSDKGLSKKPYKVLHEAKKNIYNKHLKRFSLLRRIYYRLAGFFILQIKRLLKRF